MSQEKTDDNAVAFSFLMAGEPEKKLDLEHTKDDDLTPEELENQAAEEEYLSSKSIGALGSVDFSKPDPEPKDEDEPKDDEPKDDEPKDDEPKDDEPKDEDEPKAKKTVTFKEPIPDLADDPEPEPEPEPEPAPEPEAKEPKAFTDEDEAFIDALPEDAKDSIDFWLDAEGVDEKYKGYAKKQLSYIKNHQQIAKQLRDADPDTPLEENPRYLSWVKQNKPSASRREIRRLEREIVIHEAEQRVSQKKDSQIEELRSWKERQEFERKQGPAYQERSGEYARSLLDDLGKVEGAGDVVSTFNTELEKTGDPVKAGQAMMDEYPDEAQIIVTAHKQARTMANEFLQLRMGFKTPDVEANPLHQNLANRIIAQEDAMDKPAMKQHRTRDGKTFVPAHEFDSMTPAQQRKHWKFSDDDILKFLSAEAVNSAEQQLKQHEENVARLLKRHGLEKKTPASEDNHSEEEVGKTTPKDEPRHQGADSPTSSRRGSSEDGAPGKSKLIDWDFK